MDAQNGYNGSRNNGYGIMEYFNKRGVLFERPQLEERNEEIYQLRLSGISYRDIAGKFGITIERARQIYMKRKRRSDKSADCK